MSALAIIVTVKHFLIPTLCVASNHFCLSYLQYSLTRLHFYLFRMQNERRTPIIICTFDSLQFLNVKQRVRWLFYVVKLLLLQLVLFQNNEEY